MQSFLTPLQEWKERPCPGEPLSAMEMIQIKRFGGKLVRTVRDVQKHLCTTAEVATVYLFRG